MLPSVKINFANGNLGLVRPSADGLYGILCTGVAVATTFDLGHGYKISAFSDLTALGITDVNNPDIVKIVKEFYNEAPEGTEVWLMAFADTVKLSEMVDKNENYGAALINQTNGALRGLFVSRNPGSGYSPTVSNGLDGDVYTAVANAQLLAEWATETKFAPIFVVIEGAGYSGVAGDLTDFTQGADNRNVSVLIGDTESDSGHAAIGVLAGRLAVSPVQRNVGRVKDGALSITDAFIKDVEAGQADVAGINDKGYITFRTFIGRAGYFFNDDYTATDAKDDYSHLTARRTIDKAYRIAYDTLLDQLLNEVPVNADGTLQPALIKSWEATVENGIAAAMTANGELSADINDPSDKGVKCFIDPNQNVISNSRVNIGISVRPFGYPRYIDVSLGFEAIAE